LVGNGLSTAEGFAKAMFQPEVVVDLFPAEADNPFPVAVVNV